MENTDGNKTRFFAQYWGQTVLHHVFDEIMLEHPQPICDENIWRTKSYLQLKPLSSISDEDAVGAARIIYDRKTYTGEDLEKFILDPKNGKSGISSIQAGCTFVELWRVENLISFLRLKGFALPFHGLSVEQQIDYGWIKLQTK